MEYLAPKVVSQGSGDRNVKVTTLNTFLFPTVQSNSRIGPLVEKIRASDTDLFCFQEITAESQIRQVKHSFLTLFSVLLL